MTTTNDVGQSQLREILASIDLGPTGGIQFTFAKLMLAQAMICKASAEDYMKQIESIQEEQTKCAELIDQARDCQSRGVDGEGVGKKSISGTKTTGKDCYPMSQELVDFMQDRGLSFPNEDKDFILGEEEWNYALESLNKYQENIGNKTQTLMVYLQDFMSQYNSNLQGANSAIQNASQVLTSIATGR